MTHEDSGHYAAKHPDDTIDTDLADAIRDQADQGRISCTAAHAIAAAKACPPRQVGVNIDLLEYRINRCQLGLFGYAGPKGKAVEKSTSVAPDLEKAIRDSLQDDRIACEAAWEVAERFAIPRMAVAHACEALGIKVSNCQLGAF